MSYSRDQYNNQYGGYPQNGRMPKRKKKRRIWPFILLVLLLLIGAAAVFVLVKFAKIQRNDIPKEDLVINTNLDQLAVIIGVRQFVNVQPNLG